MKRSDINNNTDDFFVGYLDTPRSLKKFYWLVVIGLLASSTLLGYWLGAIQKPAAPAHWDAGGATTMSGVITLHPYPMLHRLNPAGDAGIESVLLVGQGKHSAKYTADFDNKAVTIVGALISRGGWSMLETGSESIQLNDQIDAAAIKSRIVVAQLGYISLTGEIADSKCFLGVMKPGAGKIHKACAEVCLRGGIPSMLVARHQDGEKYGYVLTQSDGSSASQITAEYAGETVRINGTLRRRGDIFYIRIADDGLHRI